MIHTALTYVRDLLSENFKNEFSITENKVVLSNIVNPDGSVASNTDGKIVFFLLNLNEEATLKNNSNRSSNNGSGSYGYKSPTVNLNLQLLFCSNFIGNNYIEGLRYLSSLIRFFQIHNSLTPEFSDNGNGPNKLQFELCKLDYSDLSHIWSSIGSKIMPSVLYKMRLISFDDVPVSKVIPVISEPKRES